MARIQFEIPEERLKELDEMGDELGFGTRTELFNNAMSLLNWAKRQAERGRRIGAFDENERMVIELSMPPLERVRGSAEGDVGVGRKLRPQPEKGIQPEPGGTGT